MNNSRVLIYDLETTPILGWVYGTYNTNVIDIEQHSYILCFSYMWLHEKKVRCVSQIDFPARYKKDKTDDYDVVKTLRNLLDEADVVIAHNANGFDNKVGTSRFLVHDIPAPSPYRTVDTLTVARSKGRFSSNKLDMLGQQLNIGRKTKSTHGQLWKGCINGNRSDWDKMIRYCNQDVKLLHSLYLRLLPYISNHPNMAVITQKPHSCTRCGSHKIVQKGIRHTNTRSYYRYMCTECKGYMQGAVLHKDDAPRPEFKTI